MAKLNMVEFPTLDSQRVDTLRASRRIRIIEAEGYRLVVLTICRSVDRSEGGSVCLSVCVSLWLSGTILGSRELQLVADLRPVAPFDRSMRLSCEICTIT